MNWEAETVRALRPLDVEARNAAVHRLSAQLHKPRVFKRGRTYWGVVSGGLDMKDRFKTWTKAVRYAREWHYNMFRDLVPSAVSAPIAKPVQGTRG
jgi:hypothetical protein